MRLPAVRGECAPIASITRHPRADRNQHLRIVEAVLFATAEPVDAAHVASFLPEGTDVAALLADLQANYANRGVNLVEVAGKWLFRTADDLGYHPAPRDGGAAQALQGRDGDARHHRLSPAGDARRDRGHPRRGHLQGHARPAARDRLGAHARPPQDAGPPRDLWHDGCLPQPFRPERGGRPAGPAGTQGCGPSRRQPAARLRHPDAAERRGPDRPTRSRSTAPRNRFRSRCTCPSRQRSRRSRTSYCRSAGPGRERRPGMARCGPHEQRSSAFPSRPRRGVVDPDRLSMPLPSAWRRASFMAPSTMWR